MRCVRRLHAHKLIHMQTHTHTHTHKHTYIHTKTHTNTHIHTHAQTHTHTRARAHFHKHKETHIYTHKHIQLDPAPTDFRGATISFCYWRNFIIANKENKRNKFERTEFASVIRRIPLMADPLERCSTVYSNTHTQHTHTHTLTHTHTYTHTDAITNT